MDFSNDFLNSVAQEDVIFQTEIISETSVGDNYWKVIVFVEEGRFITIPSTDPDFLVNVPGTNGMIKAGVVTADNYTDYTTGLLRSWLFDLFANAEPYDVYLVTCGTSMEAPTGGTGTTDDPYTYAELTATASITVSPGDGSTVAIDGGELTLTSDDADFIVYTTDGTDPTYANGTLYSDPITGMTADTTIKAIAYREGQYNPSPIATITFTDAGDDTNLTVSVVQGDASTGTALTNFIDLLDTAYEKMKPYAYHKTVLAGSDDELIPQIALELATLCYADKDLLSAAPYYPCSGSVLSLPASDKLVSIIDSEDSADAFFTWHSDTTRNGSLYSLGLALSQTNGSGTPVGNSIDFVASDNMTLPGENDTALSEGYREYLQSINIATFKSVGDNSGSVAARGIYTYKGDVMQAMWIVAYIAYMVKVRIAQIITEMNALRNDATYGRISRTLNTYLDLFGPNGSGRLNPVVNTMPGFSDLPESDGDEFIIDNAWSGTFVHQVHKVQITGTLTIPTTS